MAYDGHGRLQSRHTPEQNAGAATVYTYNDDDTPLTVTDGRGAVTTYSYAAYDPLGNRVVPQNPPTPQSPPPPAGAMYGPSWNGSASSFSNANNYATGCYAASNNPTDCNGAMLQRMGWEFVGSLPGYYHQEYGEHHYDSYVGFIQGGGNANQYNYWHPGQSGQTGRWDPNDPNYFGTLYVTDTSTLASGRGPGATMVGMQNPVPKPLPDMEHEIKGQRLVDFNSAYDKAIKALKTTDCAKYIGANPDNGIDPAKILEHIKQQGKLLDGGTHDKYIAYQSGRGTGSVITFYNGFFSPYIGSNVAGVSKYRYLDPEMARALIILHELRHAATGIYHPTDGFFGEALPDVPESDEDFNREILSNCFGIKIGGP